VTHVSSQKLAGDKERAFYHIRQVFIPRLINCNMLVNTEFLGDSVVAVKLELRIISEEPINTRTCKVGPVIGFGSS
jgi:hypothetical protein